MSNIDLNKMDLNEIRELIKLKKEKPKEYNQFMKDTKGIFKDIAIIVREAVEEINKADKTPSVHDKIYTEKIVP